MKFNRNTVWTIILGAIVVFLLASFLGSAERSQYRQFHELNYTEFIRSVEDENVERVEIAEDSGLITGNFKKDRQQFKVIIPVNQDNTRLFLLLEDKDVEITYLPKEEASAFSSFLYSWGPMLLFIGVIIFFMRKMGGTSNPMKFKKSRAKLLTEKGNKVTFNDVAGVDEAKQELKEVVDFLKNPRKAQRLGGKIPKGVLLVGPTGTGKTLLARAVAGEAEVPFFVTSGSSFVEMFVGVGAARVRDAFEEGKKKAPCIIFIDELDAVGRHRGAGIGGGNDEREQTLNQLLVEMDGFESNEGVILISATNRPDVLDPALLRPGRFDRQVTVPNPDILGREKILEIHARNKPLASDVDLKIIARGTPGFSGAELENLLNEAALFASREDKRKITMDDVEEAKDKVMMGAERCSMVMTEDDKKLTAYHEAGHALVGLRVKKHDPLHKVTIVPRGRALGVTMSIPERDRYTYSKIELESRLAVLFGGRIAEELIFGEENVTTGARNDIQQATEIARAMVTEYGMSENKKLGWIRYSENEEEIFLGRSVTQQKNMSDKMAGLVEEEVVRLTDKAKEEARQILEEEDKKGLETIAQALMEHETLTGEEVKALLRGENVEDIRASEQQKTQSRAARSRRSVPSSGSQRSKDKG
ncbi:cell division protein FtsH [bacterium]|nr:cell division protein FtsH [bacterium]